MDPPIYRNGHIFLGTCILLLTAGTFSLKPESRGLKYQPLEYLL